MQKEKITNPRRNTENSTSLSKNKDKPRRLTEKNFFSLQARSQSQIQKQKFAQEYVKLTKQFQKILSKSSSNREYRAISAHKLNIGNPGLNLNKNFRPENVHEPKARKPELFLRNKSPHLENLYSNKLHNQILEAANRLEKSRKEKLSAALMSPISSNQHVHIAFHTPTSAYSLASPQRGTLAGSPEGDKELFLHLEQQKLLKINLKFNRIPETLAHFHNLYKIYELLENYKSNYSQLIKAIKQYIMNYNKADISKLETFLKIHQDKERLKVFLCLEKIAVLGILDAMIRQNQLCVKNEDMAIMEIIFGVYSSIFSYMSTQYKSTDKKQTISVKDEELQSLELCTQLLHNLQIQKRKDLESTVGFLNRKIQYLYRSNLTLFHRIKDIITQITKATFNNNEIMINLNSNVNLNRFFYFLLCQYAHWMNKPENVHFVKAHRNMIDFFLTCPSPHLIYAPPQGQKTIVLQLQGVLALVKFSTNDSSKISIRLRPFALQLVNELHKQQIQIVIMTALLPENLPTLPAQTGLKKRKLSERAELQYQQIIKLSSSVLFKHHYVRYRGLLVKDLSRLGRKLENLILVDDVAHPVSSQIPTSTTSTEKNEESPSNWHNTLPISTWKGNSKDMELFYLKQIIANMLLGQAPDIRTTIAKIKQNRVILPESEKNGGDEYETLNKEEFEEKQNGKYGLAQQNQNLNSG